MYVLSPDALHSDIAHSPHSRSNHLGIALDWLRRLLVWQITLTRHAYGALADDTYRGLYVPSAEVDILGAKTFELPAGLAAERATLAEERATLHAQALAHEGAEEPLWRVARLFDLTPFEHDVLLLALAPE